MQNASAGSRKRGRPAKFDHAEVVAAAIGAFFEKGFEATTLADIEAATGIDRSTLYNSFGGKSGLYTSATETYLSIAEAGLFAPLHDDTTSGYQAILNFLENLRTGLTSPDAVPGCLIVNDMAAGSDDGAATRYRQMLENGAKAALTRTDSTDEQRAYRARLITSSVIGVNLISKATGGDSKEIARHLDALTDLVTTWRQQP